jgi:hypothetical protein
MADWSQSPPKHLLAIQHHYDGPSLFFSEDSGQTWGEVPHRGGYGAVLADSKSIIVAMMKEEKGPDGKMTRPPAKGWHAKRAIKDIMLTTDQGVTYAKVGEFTPVAETTARYGDNLYWLAGEGVMVSTDDGRSWSIMGEPIDELIGGPFFGENENTMVVVTDAAFCRTTNAGEDWKKLADVWRPDSRSNVQSAWDPVSDTLCLGFLGGDVYRYRVAQ